MAADELRDVPAEAPGEAEPGVRRDREEDLVRGAVDDAGLNEGWVVDDPEIEVGLADDRRGGSPVRFLPGCDGLFFHAPPRLDLVDGGGRSDGRSGA